jgi:TFIIF-interacting CTD phosphatase-like protein
MFSSQIDKLIDMIDTKGLISRRLYRHHTINSNGSNIKCLDRLGRELSRTILLDNENLGGQGSY